MHIRVFNKALLYLQCSQGLSQASEMTVSLCIFSLLHYYALWPASVPLCLSGCLTTSSNVLSVRLRESELALHLPSSIVAFINGNIYMYFEAISQVFKRKKGHYDRIYFVICSIPPEYIRLKEQSWPAEKQERRNFLFWFSAFWTF